MLHMQLERDALFEVARRTFDTPEFSGIEFIETEAKSVINRVPGNFLPFNWTINPYRGCPHACVYCFARPTHTYMDMNAGRDFETKIVVKVNAPQVLRRQLGGRSWKGGTTPRGRGTIPNQRGGGRGRASTSPWERGPIRTSGRRAGTGSCAGSSAHSSTTGTRSRS